VSFLKDTDNIKYYQNRKNFIITFGGF